MTSCAAQRILNKLAVWIHRKATASMALEILDCALVLEGLSARVEGPQIAALAGFLDFSSANKAGIGPTAAFGSSNGPPACTLSGLRFLDVAEPSTAHGWCGLFVLRNIAAWFGTEAIALDMRRCRPKGPEQFLDFLAVRHQTAILNMSVGLFDQPFCRVPGAGGALSGDALDATRYADVLHTECDKLRRWPHLNVEETAAATAAWLCTLMGRRNDHAHPNLSNIHVTRSESSFDPGQMPTSRLQGSKPDSCNNGMDVSPRMGPQATTRLPSTSADNGAS
jgi:hypothetical protein